MNIINKKITKELYDVCTWREYEEGKKRKEREREKNAKRLGHETKETRETMGSTMMRRSGGEKRKNKTRR